MSGVNDRAILSVEDSDVDFYSLCQALKGAGISNPVTRCADSGTAVKSLGAAEGCSHAREAALILLDLNMPGIDGRELLQLFRSREPAIPVVVLSTSSHPDDIEFCYRAGANGYLVKPLEFDDWKNMIATVADYWLKTVKLPAPTSGQRTEHSR
jgi:CheY-like chemotaxis protein